MPVKYISHCRPPLFASGVIALLLIVGCSPRQNDAQPAQHTNAKTSEKVYLDDSTTSTEATQPRPEKVLAHYFHAISTGQFSNAYALWRTQSNNAPASVANLKSRYAKVSSIKVEVTGPIRQEGAAGTLYATVPITVSEQIEGKGQHSLTGQCVLARSNNVPGSSSLQRRWHLHSCDLL